MELFSALNYDETYYRILRNNILLPTLCVGITKYVFKYYSKYLLICLLIVIEGIQIVKHLWL